MTNPIDKATKSIDFEYLYKLNRVKSAELEVADFEDCGDELKNKLEKAIETAITQTRKSMVEDTVNKFETMLGFMELMRQGKKYPADIVDGCIKECYEWLEQLKSPTLLPTNTKE